MEQSAQQLAAFVDRVRGATGASRRRHRRSLGGQPDADYYVKFLGGSAVVRHYVGITTL